MTSLQGKERLPVTKLIELLIKELFDQGKLDYLNGK